MGWWRANGEAKKRVLFRLGEMGKLGMLKGKSQCIRFLSHQREEILDAVIPGGDVIRVIGERNLLSFTPWQGVGRG